MADLIYKADKTAADIDTLLAQHKNLLYHMLTVMGRLNNPDAESAAWEGLWKAIVTFNVNSGNKFSTYACTVIRNAVNDAMRKSMILNTPIDNIENITTLYTEIDSEYVSDIALIHKLFSDYVATKFGVSKNILLAWYSNSFEDNVTNIAKMCSCSTSYVSRVQCSFRAYISGKLQER